MFWRATSGSLVDCPLPLHASTTGTERLWTHSWDTGSNSISDSWASGGDPPLVSVVCYTAVVGMVCGVCLRYSDSPGYTVCQTPLRDTGDAHFALQERAPPRLPADDDGGGIYFRRARVASRPITSMSHIHIERIFRRSPAQVEIRRFRWQYHGKRTRQNASFIYFTRERYKRPFGLLCTNDLT